MRARWQTNRRSRGRLLGGLALLAAAVGVPVLLRKAGAAPPLPPQGWGRGLRYSWRGQDVHFQQTGGGEGRPVVLVHSLGPGHDGAEWQRAAELLARHYELLAPDLPGWGRSANCCPAAPAAETYVAFLRDFLADVVRRPAIVVAAGAGASFALAAVATAERVQGRREPPVHALALVCPRGLADGDEAGAAASPASAARRLGHLARLPLAGAFAVSLATSRGAVRRHLEHEVFAAPERADAALCDYYFRSARQPGASRALAAWLAGALTLDVSALLPRLAVPVWLGWGRQALSPPVETADLWLHLLPKSPSGRPAQLEVFDGAGFLPQLEAPVDFSRRLEAFLAHLR
jgi:pimeloyl-ACP methyl ester carboxylesterase